MSEKELVYIKDTKSGKYVCLNNGIIYSCDGKNEAQKKRFEYDNTVDAVVDVGSIKKLVGDQFNLIVVIE